MLVSPNRTMTWDMMIFDNGSGGLMIRCFRPGELDYQLDNLLCCDAAWDHMRLNRPAPLLGLPVDANAARSIVRSLRDLFGASVVRPSFVDNRTIDGYVWLPNRETGGETVHGRTAADLAYKVGCKREDVSTGLLSGMSVATGTVGLVVADSNDCADCKDSTGSAIE